jgi:hypothetical protein
MAYEWSPRNEKDNDVLEFTAIRCLYQSIECAGRFWSLIAEEKKIY